MDSIARQRLDLDPGWHPLLAAYAAGEPMPPANAPAPEDGEGEPDGAETAQDDDAGWLPRIDALETVPSERLPRLHGRLIAFGLLKFQLTSATTGVVYRVTPKGRTMLETAPVATEDGTAAAA